MQGDSSSEPLAAIERRTDGTCCGQGGTWAPGEGKPVAVGCMLCPQSGTYWRAGRTSGPVQPLSD
jgi:hypothetical protein